MPSLGGRLSLQVAAPRRRSPAHGVNAAFDLRGNAESAHAEPVDARSARRLPSRAGRRATVLLSTGEGERRFANLDALSRRALGEALPLQALPDWLRGRPWTGAAPFELPRRGFEQLGWQLDLARRDEGFVSATRERRAAGQPARAPGCRAR